MVHNGIEYADMQLIAEAYDLMKSVYGLSAPAMADIFHTWKQGDLDSYLIEIAAAVLRKTDSTGKPLVDAILDEAEQKGTGRWTAQNALELGVPLTAITEAVYARVLSARRAMRQEMEKKAPRPTRPTLRPEMRRSTQSATPFTPPRSSPTRKGSQEQGCELLRAVELEA